MKIKKFSWRWTEHIVWNNEAHLTTSSSNIRTRCEESLDVLVTLNRAYCLKQRGSSHHKFFKDILTTNDQNLVAGDMKNSWSFLSLLGLFSPRTLNFNLKMKRGHKMPSMMKRLLAFTPANHVLATTLWAQGWAMNCWRDKKNKMCLFL